MVCFDQEHGIVRLPREATLTTSITYIVSLLALSSSERDAHSDSILLSPSSLIGSCPDLDSQKVGGHKRK